MPHNRGEGMTGSPYRLPPRRDTGTEDDDDPLSPTSKAPQALSTFLPLNSMRRTAPPSRPYGRYPVGLRPSLDPDADFDAPSQDKEARTTKPQTQKFGLDPAPLLQE